MHLFETTSKGIRIFQVGRKWASPLKTHTENKWTASGTEDLILKNFQAMYRQASQEDSRHLGIDPDTETWEEETADGED